MFHGFVYVASFVLGSSFLTLQSPKTYTDSGIVAEAPQKLPVQNELKIDDVRDEAQQLSFILGEQAQFQEADSVEVEPGPAGIREGLDLWLREDALEISANQVKTIRDTHLLGVNGGVTHIVVYADNPQSTQQKNKILSYSVQGIDQYSISVGSELEVSKGEEKKSWKIPNYAASAPGENHIVTVRTENVFGLTDVFVDGKSLQKTPTAFGQVDIANGGDFTVGSFSTQVREVIQFNRQISEQERRHIESYLRLKYELNIQLDDKNELINDEGESLWDVIENKAYSHDMMSLVRNDQWDFSRLTETQTLIDGSHVGFSMNPDAPNRSYILSGHNDERLNQATSTHPGFQHMIGRTWKIENSSGVSKLNITYKPADVTEVDVALVIGDDPDFSDDRVYLPITTGDGTFQFNDVSIADEAYFTFVFRRKFEDISQYLGGHQTVLGASTSTGPGGVNSGLAMWLRSDQGVVVENGNVTRWTDMSGHGNDLTADLPYAYGTAPAYIENQFNFHPVVRFNHDRMTDYLGRMKFDLVGESKNLTQFIVYRHEATEKYGGVVSYASEIDTNDFLLFNPTEVWLFKNGQEQRLNKNSADGKAHTVTVRTNELVGTTDVYLDGTGKLFNYGSAGHQPGGTYVLGQDQDSVGGGFDPEQAFTGDIAEVILFQEALSDIDMLKVQSYLAVKYGMTLPTMYMFGNSDIVWDETKNSRYNNSVFGIGSDGGSGFTQRKSRSYNNSLLTIKNPTDMEDGEFLLLGDNIAVPFFKDTQLSRSWLIQEKGDVGAVDVTFDLRDVDGIDMSQEHEFVLTVSPDESFVQSKISTHPIVDGYVVTFKNVSLEDGHYLSLKAYSQQ